MVLIAVSAEILEIVGWAHHAGVYFIISIYLKAPVQSGVYAHHLMNLLWGNSLLASSGPFSTHLPQLPPTQSSVSSAVCPPDFLPARLFLFELIPGLLFLCLLSNPSSSPRLCLASFFFFRHCAVSSWGISPTHLTTFTALPLFCAVSSTLNVPLLLPVLFILRNSS